MKFLPAAGFVLVLPAFLSLSACSQTAAVSPATAAQTAVPDFAIKTGSGLPWQQLQTIDGETVQLQTGKRQLLIFFATWCHDSQRAMTQLMASELVRQQDLQIIGIGREEQVAALQKFRTEYHLNFALVSDPEKQLYQQVASKGIPQLVTVGADGQVRQVLLGEVPDAIAQLHW